MKFIALSTACWLALSNLFVIPNEQLNTYLEINSPTVATNVTARMLPDYEVDKAQEQEYFIYNGGSYYIEDGHYVSVEEGSIMGCGPGCIFGWVEGMPIMSDIAQK